jgi:hypothetical protein
MIETRSGGDGGGMRIGMTTTTTTIDGDVGGMMTRKRRVVAGDEGTTTTRGVKAVAGGDGRMREGRVADTPRTGGRVAGRGTITMMMTATTKIGGGGGGGRRIRTIAGCRGHRLGGDV